MLKKQTFREVLGLGALQDICDGECFLFSCIRNEQSDTKLVV